MDNDGIDRAGIDVAIQLLKFGVLGAVLRGGVDVVVDDLVFNVVFGDPFFDVRELGRFWFG